MDDTSYTDFYRKYADIWRQKYAIAQQQNNTAAMQTAQREMKNYAAKLPEHERARYES